MFETTLATGRRLAESYVKDPGRGWLISRFELRRLRLDRFAPAVPR